MAVISTFVLAVVIATTMAMPLDRFPGECGEEETGFRPHPDNSSKLLICSYGYLFETECPAGLVFITDKCELPQPETLEAKWTVKCAENNTDFLPHPHNSSKYVVCLDGEPHEFACAAGLVFSDNQCIHVQPETLEMKVLVTCAENQTDFLPHPHNSSKYFICLNGTPFEASCATGFVFSNMSCIWPKCGGIDYGFLPHPDNSSKYFICSNGKLFGEGRCPFNLVFVGNRSLCVRPAENNTENVNNFDHIRPKLITDSEPCVDGELKANPDDKNAWIGCSKGEVFEGGCADTMVFLPSHSLCWFDACQTDKFVLHPGADNKYFACADGEMVERECAFGHVFSHEKSVCVVPMSDLM